MITYDEALALVIDAARPSGVERVALRHAHDRVLARPVYARVDAPPHDAAAMDGYAVRDADLATLPAKLVVVGASYAGDGASEAITPGQCLRIFTGGALPAGADRVVPQELVEREGDVAVFASRPGARHVRRRGSDCVTGDPMLTEGRRCDPRALVAAAGADVNELEVWLRPIVSVLSTGDELVAPGTAAGRPGSIPESVSFGIGALVRDHGGLLGRARRLGDDPEELRQAASEVLAWADLVIVTGGASVGERDHARSMFEHEGLQLVFSKVAMKPGKPVWFGRVGERLVLGLPGNATAAMISARLLLAPLLAGMCGADPLSALRWRRAPLVRATDTGGERETFARARCVGEAVDILDDQDSSGQRALAAADVIVRCSPYAPAAAAGTAVTVLDF